MIEALSGGYVCLGSCPGSRLTDMNGRVRRYDWGRWLDAGAGLPPSVAGIVRRSLIVVSPGIV
jgi:hypothetical protein